MSRRWELTLLLTVALTLIAAVSLPQEVKEPKFTAKDRELIEAYYEHVIGALAPGSLDRSTFPPEIERALVVGGRVPMNKEKEMERLPNKLESQLSEIAGNYGRYRLGRHVILMKKEDRTIADILKNVALKEIR
jgi:hypothetical protein